MSETDTEVSTPFIDEHNTAGRPCCENACMTSYDGSTRCKLVKTPRFSVYQIAYQWLSTRLRDVSDSASHIDFRSLSVLETMESDIEKCRANRLHITRKDVIPEPIREILESPSFKQLSKECDIFFDTSIHNLRDVLVSVLEIEDPHSLHLLHKLKGVAGTMGGNFKVDKFPLLKNLTIPSKMAPFHYAFDKFVRAVVIPNIAEVMPNERQIYYQSFPCVRCVRPSEFSIGPHSDISYGFSQVLAASISVSKTLKLRYFCP